MRFIKVIFRSIGSFYKNNGLIHAAAISYFSVMAIIPFCLLMITIFGYFLGQDEELLLFFTERLSSFFPRITYEIVDELKRIITYKGIGQFTMILYILLSYQLFSSLETAVNAIFKIKTKRTFLMSFVISLFMITLVSIFIIISFGATTAVSLLRILKNYLPGLKIGFLIKFLIGYAIPFFLLFLTATSLYLFLPRVRVRLKSVISGAVFASLLFEAAKHLFAIYVVEVARLGAIYGPLSVFVMFLLWVFYSSAIFLVGAGIVHNLNSKMGSPRRES